MMKLILKTNNKSKLDKILSLARELGISVEQKEERTSEKVVIPPGKPVAVTALLKEFGKGSDFCTTEELRSKTWPSSW